MEELKQNKSGDNVDNKIRAFCFPPYDRANIEIYGNKVQGDKDLFWKNLILIRKPFFDMLKLIFDYERVQLAT